MPLGIPVKVRQAVFERDRSCCLRCGKFCPPGYRQIHHRKPRKMGGRGAMDGGYDNSINRYMPNLVTLCGAFSTDPDSCHHHVESFRNIARSDGWLVPEEIDAADAAILCYDGVRRHLTEDGGFDVPLGFINAVVRKSPRWTRESGPYGPAY